MHDMLAPYRSYDSAPVSTAGPPGIPVAGPGQFLVAGVAADFRPYLDDTTLAHTDRIQPGLLVIGNVLLHKSHDVSETYASEQAGTLYVDETDWGVVFAAALNRRDWSREERQAIADRRVRCSIGFRVTGEMVRDTQATFFAGTLLGDCMLREISLTRTPANCRTMVRMAESLLTVRDPDYLIHLGRARNDTEREYEGRLAKWLQNALD